jgi:hypothetical protein
VLTAKKVLFDWAKGKAQQICKAYDEQSKDRKRAIYEMLHIQDYKNFLAKSKWEDKVAAL